MKSHAGHVKINIVSCAIFNCKMMQNISKQVIAILKKFDKINSLYNQYFYNNNYGN